LPTLNLRTIIIALILFVGCFSVAKAQRPSKKKNVTMTTVVPNLNPSNALTREIQNYLKPIEGQVGVSIEFLPFPEFRDQFKKENLTVNIHANDTFPTMSVAKFPLAIYALMLVEGGKLSLDQPILIDSIDLSLNTYSPTTQGKTSPFSITLREAIESSVGLSDNVTTDKIIDVVGGPKAVTDFYRAMNFPKILLGTKYRDMTMGTTTANACTPNEMNRLLFEFYYGLITKPEHTIWLYGIMKNSPTGQNRLKKYMPTGTEVAHKTGSNYDEDKPEMKKVANDVGYIKLKNGLMMISVFVYSQESYYKCEDIIASIANKAYAYYSETK
jgi:beta-lactamase class A